MSQRDFPISDRSCGIAITYFTFDVIYEFLHFCHQEVLIGGGNDQFILDGIGSDDLAGQNVFVVDFPGPVFKGLNALIEAPGVLCL